MTGRPTLPPEEASILEILDAHAERFPDRRIFTFLEDGERETESLTYHELQQRAQAIAAELQTSTKPGDRAVLLYPPGLEVICALFGCFYAEVIAVPFCPPRMDLLEDGLAPLAGVTKDCCPAVILAAGSVAEQMRTASAQRAEFSSGRLIDTETIPASAAEQFKPAVIDRDTRAVLQYTSGSTGDPKGVVISHGNILHNSYAIQLSLHHRTATPPPPGTRWEAVCWLPYYHDMGLIADIIQPVYTDGPTHHFSPFILLQRPIRWLELIGRYRAHSSGGPNFAYDLCVRRVTEEQKQSLDLSSWHVAAIGAEPISAHTIDRFAEAFAPCGFRKEAFYPCYGLAEATLLVSGGDKEALPVTRVFHPAELEYRSVSAPQPSDDDGESDGLESEETERAGVAEHDEQGDVAADAGADDRAPAAAREQILVGCGHAWTDHEIVLADPETGCESPPGEVGEIWFAGPSVALGYWGREDATRETFAATLSDSGRGPFLRTGDLGIIKDGELYICGRIKDLIVIHGRNHFPEDIEQTVARVHEAFPPSGGVALGCQIDGEERLVILQEIDRQTRQLDLAALRRDIRHSIAQRHQVQVHELLFLRKGSLPKTTSGKVRRREAKQRYLAGQLFLWKPKARP